VISSDFEMDVLEGLWIASRITYLLGSFIYLLLAAALPLILFSPNVFLLGIPVAILYMVIIGSYVGYSDLTAGRTMAGIEYKSGTCHTGDYMKSILLSTPLKSRRFLLSALLRLERISYLKFLTVGTLFFSMVALAIYGIQVVRSPAFKFSFGGMLEVVILVLMACSIPFVAAWLVKPGNFIIRKLDVPRVDLERFLSETEDLYDSLP
jgi:hypothetical protein